jgi:hypothetical protein
MFWKSVIMLASVGIALGILFFGIRWVRSPSFAAFWKTADSPASIVSTGPTITALQAMGQLVTLKYSTGDVLEANDGTFKGAWIVKGDSLVAVDLRQAKLISADEEHRTLVIQLPHPKAISSRIDHEKTRTYSFQRSTWLFIPGWGDQGPLRDKAMKEAQRLVEFACSHEDVVEQARKIAQLMIRTMYQMANYTVEINWVDDAGKIDEAAQYANSVGEER